MRPNQNNKRMRGRNTNRKGPNPLSRSYESNGPDVKIRGTAHHIGEKYLQLARDAQSSGDPVMAESYLQHAEHYFRLIAAAQQAQVPFGYNRPAGEPEPEDLEEEEDLSSIPDRFASPIERVNPQQNQPFTPQPPHNSQPGYGERERPSFGNGERPQYDRPERRPERGFGERPSTPERHGQPHRDGEHRGGRGRGPRDYRQDNGPRYERHEPQDLNGKNLPAFITAPVRLQPEPNLAGPEEETLGSAVIDRPEAENEPSAYHLRQRRRRRDKDDFGQPAPGKEGFED